MKKRWMFIFLLVLFLLPLISAQESETNKEKEIDILDKRVNLPNWIQKPVQLIFGVEDQTPLQQIIVLIGVWIVLFLIIFDVLKLAFFENDIVRFSAAIIITTLSTLSGTLNFLVVFLFDIASFLKFTAENSIFKIITALLLAGFFLFGGRWIIKQLNNSLTLEKAEQSGRHISSASRFGKVISRAFDN